MVKQFNQALYWEPQLSFRSLLDCQPEVLFLLLSMKGSSCSDLLCRTLQFSVSGQNPWHLRRLCNSWRQLSEAKASGALGGVSSSVVAFGVLQLPQLHLSSTGVRILLSITDIQHPLLTKRREDFPVTVGGSSSPLGVNSWSENLVPTFSF